MYVVVLKVRVHVHTNKYVLNVCTYTNMYICMYITTYTVQYIPISYFIYTYTDVKCKFVYTCVEVTIWFQCHSLDSEFVEYIIVWCSNNIVNTRNLVQLISTGK